MAPSPSCSKKQLTSHKCQAARRPAAILTTPNQTYDISPDGQRFLMIKNGERRTWSTTRRAKSWFFTELEERAEAARANQVIDVTDARIPTRTVRNPIGPRRRGYGGGLSSPRSATWAGRGDQDRAGDAGRILTRARAIRA